MLKTKVIADNILNLTDARYFAAFGVDYLSFNPEHISTENILEIKNWVEGVGMLLEVKKNITPGLMDFIIQFDPSGFIFSDPNIKKQLSDEFPDKEVFFRKNSLESFEPKEKVILDNSKAIEMVRVAKKVFIGEIFVKYPLTGTTIEELLSCKEISGVVLEGGREEKLGFKDFDELDKIFDSLEL